MMKKLILMTVLLDFLLSGCGQKEQQQQQDHIQEQRFVEVQLIVPDPRSWREATRIRHNGRDYFIGAQTYYWIKNVIRSLPPGTYRKRIKGRVLREPGGYPHPTSMLDVVHITDMQ